MEVPKIVQELLDKKAEMSNKVDLDAYANGLLDMYQALQLQQTGVSWRSEQFDCYEIWRPNIPDDGCKTQCKECAEKSEAIKIATNV